MIPYEILIRANDLGEFQGAHAIDAPGGTPRKLTKADLKDIAPAINAASLVLEGTNAAALSALESAHAEAIAAKDKDKSDTIAAKDAKIDEIKAELTAAKAALESARDIAKDGAKSKEEKLDAIKAVAVAALLTDKQRKRKAIQDKIAELSAELADDETP
jgi:multidrug efflux pump subunit AcrA (membrane-fusion protein)